MPSEKLLDKIAPVLLVATIGLAFAVGVLWQKVSNLEGGTAGTKVAAEQAANNQPPTNGKLSEDQAKKVAPVTDEDHLRGSKDAKVFLIEYSDLECPFCKTFHPTAKQIVDEYKGEVAWIYRHFPLDTLHPKARTEAIATECAFELKGNDGFWALADKIFEVTPSNNGLNLDDLPKLAGEVGLNQEEFKACLEAEKYKDKVEAQYQSGVTAGVTGTPSNFIMNEKGEVWSLPGAVDAATLKTTIDEALGS
jgi:protein-disulfide isomerase